jgi:hypothetical protein
MSTEAPPTVGSAKAKENAQFRDAPARKLWQDSPPVTVIDVNVKGIEGTTIIATWDRVLLSVWRGEATMEAANKLLKVGREFVTAGGSNPLCFLSIIESSSPPPSDKVRKELSACFKELAPAMRHQIFVGEGSGFRGALVRGVGLAVSTIAPSLLPFKFAGSLDEASVTIAPNLTPRAGGAEGLRAAVAILRHKLDERVPRN